MPPILQRTTVRGIYFKGCSYALITQAHVQAATPFIEQLCWILPGLLDPQGLWTWLCTDILAFQPMTQLYLALLHSCA